MHRVRTRSTPAKGSLSVESTLSPPPLVRRKEQIEGLQDIVILVHSIDAVDSTGSVAHS